MIDADTLWKYPFASHTDLYTMYGSWTKNLVINGVYEFDLDRLVPLFSDITALTLRDVQMDVDMTEEGEKCATHYPSKLRQLSVIDATIYSEFLCEWLYQMDSLESLQIKSDFIDIIDLKDLDLPNLRSLTLNLQESLCTVLPCPSIKRLTIDQCWTGLDFEHVAELKELEYLKVEQAVEWKYKKQIESLRIKPVDVYYMEIPTEESLIMRLNKDCLMHLQRFLTPEDWMAFHECHSRFKTLEIVEFGLYPKSMTLRPLNTNRSYYTRIGPLVLNLEISNLKESDVYELLPFFTNLKGLKLCSIVPHTGRSLFMEQICFELWLHVGLIGNRGSFRIQFVEKLSMPH